MKEMVRLPEEARLEEAEETAPEPDAVSARAAAAGRR
jgi:hypothetical protein